MSRLRRRVEQLERTLPEPRASEPITRELYRQDVPVHIYNAAVLTELEQLGVIQVNVDSPQLIQGEPWHVQVGAVDDEQGRALAQLERQGIITVNVPEDGRSEK